jgi:hypothetical protein
MAEFHVWTGWTPESSALITRGFSLLDFCIAARPATVGPVTVLEGAVVVSTPSSTPKDALNHGF